MFGISFGKTYPAGQSRRLQRQADQAENAFYRNEKKTDTALNRRDNALGQTVGQVSKSPELLGVVVHHTLKNDARSRWPENEALQRQFAQNSPPADHYVRASAQAAGLIPGVTRTGYHHLRAQSHHAQAQQDLARLETLRTAQSEASAVRFGKDTFYDPLNLPQSRIAPHRLDPVADYTARIKPQIDTLGQQAQQARQSYFSTYGDFHTTVGASASRPRPPRAERPSVITPPLG